jgi:DNA repair protein RadC
MEDVKTKRQEALSLFEKSPELAEVKVVYKKKLSNLMKITTSKDCFDVLFSIYNKDTMEYQEEFLVLFLNRANRVLGWTRLSLGGMTGTVVDPKILFAMALLTGACSIVISHNHPSGNMKPSEADIKLTKQLKEAGKILEIPVLDHLIIVAEGCYFSFADEGMM